MLTDPEQSRRPWIGCVRIAVEFEVEMGPEDDVVDSIQAEQKAAEQLRYALTAATKHEDMSRFAREVLSGWGDVVVVASDEDPPGCPADVNT